MKQLYLVLLRGINVGGRNKIPMVALRTRLTDLGFESVSTYIASGNVVLRSAQPAARVREQIEAAVLDGFTLEDELIKALVLDREQLRVVIDDRPEGFGARPDKYHSDAIFLLDISEEDAMNAFSPREGVDEIWPGRGVIYSQRLSAERTRSRLSKITSSPLYKSMTIRSWATTLRLWDMIRDLDGEDCEQALRSDLLERFGGRLRRSWIQVSDDAAVDFASGGPSTRRASLKRLQDALISRERTPVVVGYDGSELARAAVRQTAELFPGGRVVLVTVWEPALVVMPVDMEFGGSVPLDPEAVETVERSQHEHATQVAGEGAELARSLGLEAEPHAVPDAANVAETLIDLARERDALAVVVGSHGRSGLRSLMLGSVSHKVIGHCDRPVVVIRGERQ